jgi:phosphate acetyltransferase/phosphate butyryltransferase
METTHPRLQALMARATAQAGASPQALGLVYPCDPLALDAARRIHNSGMARPVLIGPAALIAAAADTAQVDMRDFELIDSGSTAPDAALRACGLARSGDVRALMKGSLHTDELMAAVVNKDAGLRGSSRISHAFIFELPRYHKLLALADCVVNIAPDLKTKKDILGNAVALLHKLGIAEPKVGIVAAVEVVNPSIPATLDAQALVAMAHAGAWPGAIVEGPFGFDNAFSKEAARIKNMESQVAGDADLFIMPDLNAGNMLYKSFNYVGGGDCAGLVLGAQVPIVLTSRADSLQSRMASVALAVLTAAPG